MARYSIEDTTLTNIANAIRSKTGSTESIMVSDMPDQISSISGGVKSWNDLTDKPFGDESVTIEWDGNTEGLTEIELMGLYAYKVSNLTPEPDQLVGGTLVLGSDTIVIEESNIGNMRESGFIAVLGTDKALAYITYEDNVSVTNGLVFPEKGCYFFLHGDAYISSLTYGSLKKLDPKYLPLPEVTEADNGKFLRVVDGAIALVALQDVSKEGA